MARKRMVDPDFWLDEEITGLSFECRLFFIGTWNFADDYGVVENSPKKLKAQIFPYDDVDVSKIIEKLVKMNKLVTFEAEGKSWLYIRKFLKYQRVDKPSKIRNPQVPNSILGEDSENTQEPLNDEEKRREEKRREEKIEHRLSYLENIPDSDVEEFYGKYEVSRSKIKEKGQALFFWCNKKGRTYKNYRMALQDALLKDFGLRTKKITPHIVEKEAHRAQISQEMKEAMRNAARGIK